jgi:hypothetical protein
MHPCTGAFLLCTRLLVMTTPATIDFLLNLLLPCHFGIQNGISPDSLRARSASAGYVGQVESSKIPE